MTPPVNRSGYREAYADPPPRNRYYAECSRSADDREKIRLARQARRLRLAVQADLSIIDDPIKSVPGPESVREDVDVWFADEVA